MSVDVEAGTNAGGALQTVSTSVPSQTARVRNEWTPAGQPLREVWYQAKQQRKEADDQSKMYENRIKLLEKKRERALKMLENTKVKECQLAEMRQSAQAEADARHTQLQVHNQSVETARRDARNMVEMTRASSHLNKLGKNQANLEYKRQVNEEKAQWKADRLEQADHEFQRRKGIRDYVHSTDVAVPKMRMAMNKQQKLDETREWLCAELNDHQRVVSQHSSRMDGWANLEQSMIDTVKLSESDHAKAQDDIEKVFMSHDKSFRVDRMVRARLREDPLPPQRPHPFTARP